MAHGSLSITRLTFSKAEVIANRLPQRIERSILLQAIAKIQGKRLNPSLTEETVDKALKAARSIYDGRRAFLFLTAAAQLANVKSAAASSSHWANFSSFAA